MLSAVPEDLRLLRELGLRILEGDLAGDEGPKEASNLGEVTEEAVVSPDARLSMVELLRFGDSMVKVEIFELETLEWGKSGEGWTSQIQNSSGTIAPFAC